MRNVFINIILFELVLFIGVFLVSYSVNVYKQLLPHDPFVEDVEDEVYAPINEVYDDGYIEELNGYDARISDMKEYLKVKPDPAVEIITDEYERSMER
jgi:hypothetical protein